MIPKFRVWLPDPDVKRMLRVKALVFENDKTRCVCGYSYDFYLEDEDAILMQSTGLLDKDSKEIFDGDILATETKDGLVKVIVFWDNEHALFMVESKTYNKKSALAELIEDGSSMTIIGNIHENSALLEK
jgi:uncharacterized phage protein (TIGR01671 family)|uniref:YopX protein n=1 Tax=Siphoviridae sp. ctHip2 TaxID=2827830 RepID=A0A8S5RVP5_9CAUD|nr:MAG TPA: YopX protein [Siphoviridae sp. ctHip2]